MPEAPTSADLMDGGLSASLPTSNPASFPASAPASAPASTPTSLVTDSGLADSGTDAGITKLFGPSEPDADMMAEDLDKTADFIQDVLSNYGLGLTIGLVMLVALLAARAWFKKQPELKRKLNAPTTWTFVYLVVLGIRVTLSGVSWLGFITQVFLLIAIISTASFFFFDLFLVRWRQGREVPGIIRDLVQAILFLTIVLVLLSGTGVDVSSLVVGSTVLTAVIGLALQDTLSNVIAGLAIQIEKPFEEGDFVTIGGAIGELVGQVISISWRTTKIRTRYEDLVIIPNKTVADDSLINHSKPARMHRRKLKIGAPYKSPPNVVAKVLMDAVRDTPGVMSFPGPEVNLIGYGDFTVDYVVRYSIENFRIRFDMDDAVLRRIWYHFSRAGIEFPFPVRDVRMREVTEVTDRKAYESELARRRRLIDSIQFLSLLSDKERDLLCEHIESKHYGNGEPIITQGDAGDSMYLVDDGNVDVRIGRGAAAHTVATLGPGSMFGEMSLMTGEPRSATVVAAGDVMIYEVEKRDFDLVFRENEKLFEKVSEALARRQAGLKAASSDARPTAQAVQEKKVDLLKRIRSFFRSK